MTPRYRLNLLLFVIFLLFAACSQTETPPVLSPELTESVFETPTPRPAPTTFPTEEILHGTVIIRHSWEEDKLPVLAAIIKSFQSYHPDVMFDVLYIPPELLLEQFIADSNEGLAPDLLLGPAEWGPELFQQDLLADLSADISSNLLNSLNPAALESARIDPALIGLPYSINGVVLYRNKDVITIQADNFNELVTLAQTSTQGATIGSYLERSFFYSGGHLIGLGGEFIDSNGLPAFNNGQGVAWLELLTAFDQAGPTNFFGDADLDRFKLGEIGWIIDGSWNLIQLSEAIGAEKLAVDPWPAYLEGSMSGFVLSENIYLSSKSSGADRRSAVEFIRFMVMPEAQSLLADSVTIPSATVFKGTDPIYGPLVAQVSEALAGGAAYPLEPEFTTYSLIFDQQLRAYFEQDLPPEQVLQSAQDAILAELAEDADAVGKSFRRTNALPSVNDLCNRFL